MERACSAKQYNVDAYGCAVSDIVRALELAFANSGNMNEHEYNILIHVANELKNADSYIELRLTVK